MKIAVIGQRDNPYVSDRVFGGVDMVERTHLKLLAMYGEDVYFITSSNSDRCQEKGVTTLFVSEPAKFNPPCEVNLKKRFADIRSQLEKLQPDVILVHDSMTVGLKKAFIDIAPSICFMHDVAGIFGLSSIGYINNYISMMDRSLVIGVSEQSNKDWLKFINTTKMVTEKKSIDQFLHPAVMWEYPPSPARICRRAVVIGRLVEQKKISTAIDVLSKSEIESTFFFPGRRDETEEKFYEKLEKSGFKRYEGLHHPNIMRYLSGSSMLCVFGKESFGLTAFEANVRGVPVYLLSKDTHAVEEATVPIGLKKFSDKNEMIDAIKRSVVISEEESIQIQEETYLKFNSTAMYLKLLLLLEAAKMKFPKSIVQQNSLEDFLQ